MIFYTSWNAYEGPGRLAVFGSAPHGARRGYRVLGDLLPGSTALHAPDDRTFRKLFGAHLLDLDAKRIVRLCHEAVYPAVPVFCLGDDPWEADALALTAPWLAVRTGVHVLPMPKEYRPRNADPRSWRRIVS